MDVLIRRAQIYSLSIVDRDSRSARLVLATALGLTGACAAQRPSPASITEVVRPRTVREHESTASTPASTSPGRDGRRSTPVPVQATEPAIARVNGVEIPRREFTDLVIRAHGIGVLEQWIGLDAAREHAERRGIAVHEDDVRRERERALRRLAASGLGEETPDVGAAEQSLEAALSARNISPEELDLVLRRNAYLRKCVEADMTLSDADVLEEMDRAYGPRVVVRHIQLATPAEADRILERYVAGVPFDELARTHSTNRASAGQGGLLEPFSRGDSVWPAVLRETAFSLEQGAVSPAIRVGAWYHLVRLEQRIPAVHRDLAAVRPELERRVRERKADEGMFALYENLVRTATIEINDPGLRSSFERRKSQRNPTQPP